MCGLPTGLGLLGDNIVIGGLAITLALLAPNHPHFCQTLESKPSHPATPPPTRWWWWRLTPYNGVPFHSLTDRLTLYCSLVCSYHINLLAMPRDGYSPMKNCTSRKANAHHPYRYLDHAFSSASKRPRAQLGCRLHMRPWVRKHAFDLKCLVVLRFLLLLHLLRLRRHMPTILETEPEPEQESITPLSLFLFLLQGLHRWL